MRAPTALYTEWLDAVADLGKTRAGQFPRSTIADLLARTFDCVVSWNWLNADGAFGFELREPIPGFPPPDHVAVWAKVALREHPLLVWYAVTRDPSPMTIGRVPPVLVPSSGFSIVREMCGPYGLGNQLSIPYQLGERAHRAFVLARSDRDFSDRDLDLARRIQPLLAVLDRQLAVCRRVPDEHADTGRVTGRELAVLQLLSEGLTATAIAHRLLLSPRTVHAHLRSLYRKLGVSDRMQAVLVAQRLGMIAVSRQALDRANQSVALPRPWASPIRGSFPDCSPPGGDAVAG